MPSDVRDRLTIVSHYVNRELPTLLHDSHILLFASWSEGFSLALLEAMACGLAPVATNTGVAPDALSGKSAGLLVPPGDVDGLVAAIERLLNDRMLLETLRRGARDVAKFYSWSAVASTVAALYEDLLKKKSASRGSLKGILTKGERGD